jgi:hypothetical protein
MTPSIHPSRLTALSLAFITLAHASDFATVWQLGADDQNLSPFSQESFEPNNAPGSASIMDDDYYLTGIYPSPIGMIATDEPIANFERAVTSGDPRNRIHFPLTAAQASSASLLRITIDLTSGGAWINGSLPGFSTHDIAVRFNGNLIATRNGISWDHTIVLTLPASSASAVAGANVLQIERTGGGAGGYIGFDYVKLEADTSALLDADGDGMPRWFEDTYGFSDQSPADAAGDPDEDSLGNLQEFQKGTNPTDPDSDNDGLTDGAELVTNPTLWDTDGDGLSDGAETSTSPLLADTDGDGIPDPVEIGQGSDPANGASMPFDYPGAIGLQFVSEQRADAKLGDWELAGRFRFHHWNATSPLPHSMETGTVLNGSITNLKNHRGQSTSAAATWSHHHAGDGLHKGTGDERLLNGMIRTQRNASLNTPATVTLTAIPYATYDLIVYPGYIYPNSRGVVRLDGNSATSRYFVSDSAPPFTGWREATATTLATIRPGNFLRYRNLTGASRSVSLESVDFETVGIHAIQIIDSGTDTDGDGIKDITELEHAFNPAVADATADKDGDGLNNLAELTAGTDPNDPDSDNDGIPDGAEAALGTSPLDADSDNDGLLDGAEVNGSPFASSPLLTDTDGDGFSDPTELAHSSDPASAASVPPPVPVWDAPTRTWRWRIDNLRVLWNHRQSMLGAIQYDDSMLCEAVADIEQSGWSRQIAIGLRHIGGRITHRFRGIEGAFHQNGNPDDGFWDSDWNIPPADRLRDFGFSGYGHADDSKPLRLEFTATQPVSGTNLWNINFLIADLTNPATPVTLAMWSRTNAVAAHASLLTGTTVWRNSKGQTGRIDLNTETGARALISPAAPGTPDADSDGMPDSWETTHLFNPNNASDAAPDTDGDGLSNVREFLAGTDPRDPDSDGDGAPDGVEIHHGSNPLSNSSLPAWFNFAGNITDLDGDGLSDAWVLWSGGSPRGFHRGC